MRTLREFGEEIRVLIVGRGHLADVLIPALAFPISNTLLGFQAAMWTSLATTVVIGAVRLFRGERLRYVLGGVAGIVGAVVIAELAGQGTAYFLPGMITGGLTTLACPTSVLAHRPLAALISFAARHWPLEWYLHPRVRPAYNEVTLIWGVLLAIRLAIYCIFYQREDVNTLVALDFISGWPGTVALLVSSYLYCTWRLRKLGAPSVAEFKKGNVPPYNGKRKGF